MCVLKWACGSVGTDNHPAEDHEVEIQQYCKQERRTRGQHDVNAQGLKARRLGSALSSMSARSTRRLMMKPALVGSRSASEKAVTAGATSTEKALVTNRTPRQYTMNLDVRGSMGLTLMDFCSWAAHESARCWWKRSCGCRSSDGCLARWTMASLACSISCTRFLRLWKMDGRLRLPFDGCLDAADNVDDRVEKPTRPCVRHNLEGVPTDISRSLRAGRGNETPGKRLAPSNLFKLPRLLSDSGERLGITPLWHVLPEWSVPAPAFVAILCNFCGVLHLRNLVHH